MAQPFQFELLNIWGFYFWGGFRRRLSSENKEIALLFRVSRYVAFLGGVLKGVQSYILSLLTPTV